MAIVTKTRFSDVVFKDKDTISDRSGSRLIQAFGVPYANSYIGISNDINDNPRIISTGTSNIGISIGVKGSGSVKIYSDLSEGSILFQNQSGGEFGFKANVSSSSRYFMVMPSSLPVSERFLTVDQSGNLDYSASEPEGASDIQRENKSGNENTTTSINGYLFREFVFSQVSNFQSYHQNFLNGILQLGLQVSNSAALSVNSGEIDYMFNTQKIYFLDEHVDDSDIISVFAKA